MLRRNSSRGKQHHPPLGRSKSTNSILSNPVHGLVSIEPFVAERDAYIAATLSYQRAHARRRTGDEGPSMLGGSSTIGLSRGHSFTSKADITSNTSTQGRFVDDVHGGPVKRKQSVRFAGPKAKPGRALAIRAANDRLEPAGICAFPDFTSDIENQSLGSSLLDDKLYRDLGQTYKRPFHNALNSREENDASRPLSYRKLRKSRSMLTPVLHPKTEHSLNSYPSNRLKEWLSAPSHQDMENKENNPNLSLNMSTLRSPRSMGLLPNLRKKAASQTSGYTINELPIQLARQSLHENAEPASRLKSHPSVFFRARQRRSHSSAGFPVSLRNSSDNSAALSSTFSGDTLSISKQARLRTTAREVSRSLKSRLKGLFSRPRSTTDTAEPPSHDIGPGSDTGSCRRMNTTPSSFENASLSQVPTHAPSLHAVPLYEQMKSRQGSVDSIGKESNDGNQMPEDKSRVTSWTDSITNTIESQGDWERQRLSVIRENGMHISSTTLPRNHFSSLSHDEMIPSGLKVDSQRVYSALLKRLDEIKQNQSQSLGKNTPKPASHEVSLLRSKPSIVQQDHSYQPSVTIRCVSDEDDDVFQDISNDGIPNLHMPASSQGSVARGRQGSASTKGSVKYKAYPNPEAGDGLGLSPEIALFGSRGGIEPPSTLSDRSSAFFASPTYHLFRTASPYRRALQDTMKTCQGQLKPSVPDSRYLSSLSAISLPTRRPSTVGSERELRTTDADSVYSYCSQDTKVFKIDSTRTDGNVTVPADPATNEHGDATIFVEPSPYRSTPLCNRKRNHSSASSIEWKTWLSANVSKLETPSATMETEQQGGAPYTPHPIRHIREDAEIESHENTLKRDGSESLNSVIVTPLNLVRRVEAPKMITMSGDMAKDGEITRYDVSAVHQNSSSDQGPYFQCLSMTQPPPIPLRSSLRSIPSLPNVNTRALHDTGLWRTTEIPPMRSLNAIAKLTPPSREKILLKRKSRAQLGARSASPAKSRHSLFLTPEKRFDTTSTGSPEAGGAWRGKRYSLQETPKSMDDKCLGIKPMVSDLDAQVMGSKRMVDLFLSSRQKSSEESTAAVLSESLPPAFI